MHKILERDVARHIIQRQEGALEEIRRVGGSVVRYPKSAFRADMMAQGFIHSRDTVDSKWIMLRADRIVQELDGLTYLDIPRLYLAAGIMCPPKGGRARVRADVEEGQRWPRGRSRTRPPRLPSPPTVRVCVCVRKLSTRAPTRGSGRPR